MRNNQKFSAMRRMALAMLLILAGPFCALAQIKVSGKITDETNTPMAGVSIIEIGTQNGAISDVDGNWSLTASEGAVLEFYYLGYVTIRKTATAGTMNVRMEPDTQVLEETVVVGYGVQKRSSLTGAVSQVKSEDMESRTITSASQALQGKTSGVQVLSSSAKPGREAGWFS